MPCKALHQVQRGSRRSGAPRGMTLTTFRDVPWDRPFYERAGFRVLGPDEIDQAVLAVVAREDAAGLRRAERVVVRIPLPPERIG